MPTEPTVSSWDFPDLLSAAAAARFTDDSIGYGADLAAGTLLRAYRRGIFPMGDPREAGLYTWWSPVSRGVLPLDRLKVSRSLAASRRGLEVRIDTAFGDVLDACADRSRPGAWITPEIRTAYAELHRLGWAHSVETWRDGELVGGLYGLAIGGLFAGESMFHRVRDASKVALVGLVEVLRDEYADLRLLDVQWETPHLASLGVISVPREEYLRRLHVALALPLPARWTS